MIKMFITDAVVSKGYNGADAIRFYDLDNGQIANFRIGVRVYDSKAENNHRWVNLTVKAFGPACERVKKMKLKDGSYVNILGRYDEDTWKDKQTGEDRKDAVLLLDDIEYCYSGNGEKAGKGNGGDNAPAQGQQQYGTPPAPQGQTPYPGSTPAVPQQQGMPYQQGWPAPQGAEQAAPPPPMPQNFTGFEGFGAPTGNPYF